MNNKSVKVARIACKICLGYFIVVLVGIGLLVIFAKPLGDAAMFLALPAFAVYVCLPAMLIVLIISGLYWVVNRKNLK